MQWAAARRAVTARVSWIHPVLQLSAALECLDQPLPSAAEPQPGLFLADLFIWVLHCWRPRLSFCCTCARVHNPGSSRHLGGVSFYPKSPSGIDNCFTEHQGERMESWRGPSTGRGNVCSTGSRRKRLDLKYMNNKLGCFKSLFL